MRLFRALPERFRGGTKCSLSRRKSNGNHFRIRRKRQYFYPVPEDITEAVAGQPYSPATFYCGNEAGDGVVFLQDRRFVLCRSENRINEEMIVRELLRHQNDERLAAASLTETARRRANGCVGETARRMCSRLSSRKRRPRSAPTPT
jgi:hypothetical protein